ncbi:hypothetical protein PROFUN_13728 [Planoprotostelium fungivorum]|uniref:Uncharacterized protein n=1 Tax=Planoprotostelium fungivorum TaxID=1890364 RepID=A0A2P6MWU0_9EUKA|nr:hypothetical protein PROFUN_13728 [Planoprotostelium fungivorum]
MSARGKRLSKEDALEAIEQTGKGGFVGTPSSIEWEDLDHYWIVHALYDDSRRNRVRYVCRMQKDQYVWCSIVMAKTRDLMRHLGGSAHFTHPKINVQRKDRQTETEFSKSAHHKEDEADCTTHQDIEIKQEMESDLVSTDIKTEEGTSEIQCREIATALDAIASDIDLASSIYDKSDTSSLIATQLEHEIASDAIHVTHNNGNLEPSPPEMTTDITTDVATPTSQTTSHLRFSQLRAPQMISLDPETPRPLFGQIQDVRFVYRQEDKWIDWTPSKCTNDNLPHPCDVIHAQNRPRDRLYDLSGPVAFTSYSYYCRSHKEEFFLNSCEPPAHVVSMISNKAVPILMFQRTIVTQRLWDHIVSIYFEVRNYHELSLLSIPINRAEANRYETSLEGTSYLDISLNFAERPAERFFSKSLGTFDEKGKRIQLASYVLVVMNEDGMVLHASIVPSVGHEHTLPILEGVIKTPGKAQDTQAMYLFTDNIGNDGPAVIALYQRVLNRSITVCQDTFHVIQRVCKFMSKGHPDFALARRHLSNILHKVNRGAYLDQQEFIDAMERWIDRWSDPDLAAPMSNLDLIKSVGDLEAGRRTRQFQKMDPVATPSAVHCIRNQIKEPVLSGLMNLGGCKFTQGTSPIENFNNILASFRPRSQGFIGMESLDMSLQMAVIQFNLKKGEDTSRFCLHHLLSLTVRASVVVSKPIHETWSFEDAKAAGYRSKVEKVKWTPEQDAALTKAIEAISSGKNIPHTQDPFWYMTSTFLDQKMDSAAVRKRINERRHAAARSSEKEEEPMESAIDEEEDPTGKINVTETYVLQKGEFWIT